MAVLLPFAPATTTAAAPDESDHFSKAFLIHWLLSFFLSQLILLPLQWCSAAVCTQMTEVISPLFPLFFSPFFSSRLFYTGEMHFVQREDIMLFLKNKVLSLALLLRFQLHFIYCPIVTSCSGGSNKQLQQRQQFSCMQFSK